MGEEVQFYVLEGKKYLLGVLYLRCDYHCAKFAVNERFFRYHHQGGGKRHALKCGITYYSREQKN